MHGPRRRLAGPQFPHQHNGAKSNPALLDEVPGRPGPSQVPLQVVTMSAAKGRNLGSAQPLISRTREPGAALISRTRGQTQPLISQTREQISNP